MNKRGFDEKFFAELYDYMNDRQTDSEFREMLWRWIEQYGTEQRIDENKHWENICFEQEKPSIKRNDFIERIKYLEI